jgi:hypothetical protein
MTRSIYTGLLAVLLTACGTAAAKESMIDSAGGDAGVAGDKAPIVARNSDRRSLADGARVEATIEKTFSSRTSKAGETVLATVSSDVTDALGGVVIPSGSRVTLVIDTLDPGSDQIRPAGRLGLTVTSVAVNGRSYPVVADLTPVTHQLVPRGITNDEAERIGAGTAIGAIAGRLIGKSTKSTVIGGAAGAIAGTAVAIHYAYRDVVVSAGTPITFTLSRELTVSAR